MNTQSTYALCEQVAESILNGQHKQALQQAQYAFSEYVAPTELVQQLRDTLGDNATINFLIRLIEV